jgi:hypothetical protein
MRLSGFGASRGQLSAGSSSGRSLRPAAGGRIGGRPGIEPLRRELLEDSWQCYQALIRPNPRRSDASGRAGQDPLQGGGNRVAIGRHAAGLDQYAAARDLFAALVREILPRRRTVHLGLCDNNLGLVLASCGRTDGGDERFQQAEQQAASLCRDEPGITAHRWRRALVHTNTGSLHSQARNVAAADAGTAKPSPCSNPWLAAEPQRDEFRKDLAVAFNNRGALHRGPIPRKPQRTMGEPWSCWRNWSDVGRNGWTISANWPFARATRACCWPNEATPPRRCRSCARRSPLRSNWSAKRRPASIIGAIWPSAATTWGASCSMAAICPKRTAHSNKLRDFPAALDGRLASAGDGRTLGERRRRALNNRAMIRQQQGDLAGAAELFEQVRSSAWNAPGRCP